MGGIAGIVGDGQAPQRHVLCGDGGGEGAEGAQGSTHFVHAPSGIAKDELRPVPPCAQEDDARGADHDFLPKNPGGQLNNGPGRGHVQNILQVFIEIDPPSTHERLSFFVKYAVFVIAHTPSAEKWEKSESSVLYRKEVVLDMYKSSRWKLK